MIVKSPEACAICGVETAVWSAFYPCKSARSSTGQHRQSRRVRTKRQNPPSEQTAEPFIFFSDPSESIGIWRSINGACIIIALECGRVCNTEGPDVRVGWRGLLSRQHFQRQQTEAETGGAPPTPNHPTHPHTLSCMHPPRRRNLSRAPLNLLLRGDFALEIVFLCGSCWDSFLFYIRTNPAASTAAGKRSNKSQWQLPEKNVSPT